MVDVANPFVGIRVRRVGACVIGVIAPHFEIIEPHATLRLHQAQRIVLIELPAVFFVHPAPDWLVKMLFGVQFT